MESVNSIQQIETLLDEFYRTGTNNSRKREIETNLIAYKSLPIAWENSLQAVLHFTPNQFLWFFSASTLEHTVTRRWFQLAEKDRKLIRETIWNIYVGVITSGVPMQRRQRETLAQLIALMGKREFPDDHPEFVNHILGLAKTQFSLGINLLRVTSEEVTSTRQDMPSDRKTYFISCINLCVPDILELVTKYLLTAVCYINGKDMSSIPNHFMDYNIINAMPHDTQLSAALLELLSCCQHLVSWIQIELISEYFIMSIIDLSQWREDYQEITYAALLVLNELFYIQKPLPYGMTLMVGVNNLLDQHNMTKNQSEVYIDKFRELMRLYTVKYWPKLINEPELLDNFLKSLFCCTVTKNGALDFTEKLEIWTPIMRGLILNQKLMRFNDIVHQLVVEIIRRTLFEYNKPELELLDNEYLEDNSQTEWQHFQTQCIESLSLIAEARPGAVFQHVFAHWERPHAFLMSVQEDYNGGKHAELSQRIKCPSFGENFRDYSTICQALVRLTPMLDANATTVSNDVLLHLNVLMENLLTSLAFFTTNKLVHLDIENTTFQADYDYLYAQAITAVRSILPVVLPLNKSNQLLHNIVSAVGTIFEPPNPIPEQDIDADQDGPSCSNGRSNANRNHGANAIGSRLPKPIHPGPVVYVAASQLLLSISTVIRPKGLFDIPSIINLLHIGPRLTHLPKQAIANIYTSLVGYLVLPWKNATEEQQEYERRLIVLGEYVESLAEPFMKLDSGAEAKAAATALNLLDTFSSVIEYFKDATATTKEMLTTTLKPIITKSLVTYNTFGLCNNPLAIAVAEFGLNVLRAFQVQLGQSFVKEMVTLFISVNNRENINMSRVIVMEKILQMFQIIIEQPGNTSVSMLPSILDFTIDSIVPLLQKDDAAIDGSDITSLIFALFDSTLLYKWQYFYKSQITHNGQTATVIAGDNLHPDHFMSILNAYGQIIINGSDPNIVRSVLQSLQTVHDRWHLYDRPLFKENLLASFQCALIGVLLSGEGGLHFDLLSIALFYMGQVDSIKLHESFISSGFTSNAKLLDEICRATDIPTFSQKLNQLVSDAQCEILADEQI